MRRLLHFTGKTETRVAVVFGCTAESSRQAVSYLRQGAPDVPVFLFSTVEPSAQTAELCSQVYTRSSAIGLFFLAERILWRYRVAISVGVWNGASGQWLMKLAPFLVPPFRVLLLNAHGDFLPGSPRYVMLYARRILHDGLSGIAEGTGEAWHWLGDGVRATRRKTALTGLWAAAALLRVTGYPHRRWFARMRRDRTLEPSPETGSATGIAVFTQSVEHWDGAAFERFARSTNSRWILWRSRNAVPAKVEDLVAPFRDSSAFAASPQQYFRGWKPLLLPTSPFRALQPGETAQVLAPVAPEILVDRQKLLALGIPRCGLPDTAWRLCFWKAAAAGWRSFSVGQGQTLKEEPDHPVQETAFFLRLLADRSLRTLSPREPELSGGSIAFAPALQTSVDSGARRLKVLLVSPFLPFPLSHGGAVRIYNLCRVLSQTVDFVLIAMREKGEAVDYERLHEIFREVYVVDIDERASGDARLPEQVRRTQSRALRALMSDIAGRWKPDVLQVEYTHMAAFRDAVPHVPAILVEHDLTFSLYRQLADGRRGEADRREFERWLQFERQWLAAYNGVWTVSSNDCRTAIEVSGRPRESTFVVPNGVDVRRFAPGPMADGQEILYVGSFRHLPNVLGFENLRREIMPRVWKKSPGARLVVVAGKDAQRYWSGPADARIELHGFVEDLRPLYARASAVAVPLGPSAGTNIKVLEAMACGTAVVTTSTGCAGLELRDGLEVAIRDDWDSFAEALCKLLADKPERARLGACARSAAEARFSWDSIAQGAYETYVALSERAPAELAAG